MALKKKKKKQAWEYCLKDKFLTRDKKENPYIIGVLYAIIILLSALLIFVSFFQLCHVKGHSMEPSLKEDSHVLLNKSFTDIKRGDIVVITKGEAGSTEKINIIKRVIAIPGDEIKFEYATPDNNFVTLFIKKKGDDEFKLLDESYILEPMETFSSRYYSIGSSYVIENGTIFALGDNRNNSVDSREDGAYYKSSVLGVVSSKIKKDSLIEKLLMFLYQGSKPQTN